jgi:hypothetical protein
MDRVHAEEFLALLLHAHGAEDAFEPVPEEADEAAQPARRTTA